MLTKHELREMRELVTRIQKGSVSKDDWAQLAALTLVWQGDTVVTAIAAEGYKRFVETVAPIYERHEFEPDDYQNIYARICIAADRALRDRVQ
jgi:hypothetical protein